VIESDQPAQVEAIHNRIVLHVRPGTDQSKRRAIMEEWYRGHIKKDVPPLIAIWERLMGVKVERFFVQRMKTKWGSCNPHARTIRLNTDLAKKPRECMEYVLVHELVHLLEPTHNTRFIALMDQLMPGWKSRRDALNGLPVSHESWTY
jgi:predicted metal-dependent hydrolase